MTEIASYGSWRSALDARRVAAASVSIGEVAVGGGDLWWSELRPSEQGRVAVVRHHPGGGAHDVLSEGFSARTRVHEYGGGAWWLHDVTLFFANWSDQRLYRLDPGSEPRPLSPEPPVRHGYRYADGVMSADGNWVVCVRESHPVDGTEAANEIVAVDAHEGGDPVVLVSGADFVSNPRVSPDGTRLCWLQWDHPAMPWDATQLWVGELQAGPDGVSLSRSRQVAGGIEESIFQPEWRPDGSLLFVSDRTDWWNLYEIPAACLDDEGTPEARHLAPVEAEIGMAQWVFGQRRYAQLVDGRILCAFARDGRDHLGIVSVDGETMEPLVSDISIVSGVVAFGEGAALVAATPRDETAVMVAGVESPATGSASLAAAAVSGGAAPVMDPASISEPESIDFTSGDGRVAHALYYAPKNPDHVAPDGERPPLVVLSHGGPTSSARPMLNLSVQYWTTRGVGVVDVNYGGSTGYGRGYRRQLDGTWGVVDVDDCVAAARYLVDRGDADPDRLAIKGGSAGGFTTLCALTFRDVFAAGASRYGVADLEALAKDTHKFESRYLDTLIGPYPQARELYEQRSPIHHTEGLNCPLIVLQGLEDEVVPPSQAEMMVGALAEKGIAHAYVAFEGEQHGFRKSQNIVRALEAELYFLSRVFNFEPADPIEPVRIENA